jgi:hypothetical protein
MSDVEDKAAGANPDKPNEYFEQKRILKNLRRDIRDLKQSHPRWNELQKINKQAKEIRDEIKEEEEIKILEEKAKGVKERIELMKEMIRIDLIENSEVEVKKDGKVLKLVYVLKEVKDEE